MSNHEGEDMTDTPTLEEVAREIVCNVDICPHNRTRHTLHKPPHGTKCDEHTNIFLTALTKLKEQVAELQKWNADMVAKAASGGVLDGYRELGQRAANAEARAEAAEAELSKMKARHVSDLSRAMGLLDSLGYQDSYLNNRLAALSEHEKGEK